MTNDEVKDQNTQESNSLNEQLLDLQLKVDEQNDEIKLLQQTKP